MFYAETMERARELLKAMQSEKKGLAEKTRYEAVRTESQSDMQDASELLVPESAQLLMQVQRQQIAKLKKRTSWYLGSSVFLSLLVVVVAVVGWKNRRTMLECDKMLSPWSSAWDAVEYWEGDAINPFTNPSIYRGPPTPEREKAWDDLWHHKGVPVTREGIIALNKTDKGPHVEAYGSDPNNPTYGSIVEVFHQIHCLNMLRQATWLDRYDPDDPWYPYDLLYPVAGRIHLDHCIEALRLSLMCNADITPVLVIHNETIRAKKMADFSVHKKCRNFDKIRDWVEEHGVRLPKDQHPGLEVFEEPIDPVKMLEEGNSCEKDL
ncbi:hypothetical protein OQA88_10022 [Cercophora sp. LCS_1]